MIRVCVNKATLHQRVGLVFTVVKSSFEKLNLLKKKQKHRYEQVTTLGTDPAKDTHAFKVQANQITAMSMWHGTTNCRVLLQSGFLLQSGISLQSGFLLQNVLHLNIIPHVHTKDIPCYLRAMIICLTNIYE